jgi:hypothetical protein
VLDGLTYKELNEQSNRFSDFQDLWFRYDNSPKRYSVIAGFFKNEKEAIGLLDIVKKDFPKSKIIKTSYPDPHLWLPRTRKINLNDIGITAPIRAEGFQSYASMQYPWAHYMSASKSTLKLFLKISPLLNERSSIKVVVEKIPIYNKRIKELGSEPTIEIPLNKLEGFSIGEKLDVEIFGYFSITDDRCADEPSGNLWMVIDLESFLQYSVNSPILTIKDYFKNTAESYNIVLERDEPSYVEAAIKLAGFIGSLSPSFKTRLKFSPVSERQKNIFIGPYTQDAELYGSNLYITPQGIDILINKWASSLPFSSVKLYSYDKSSFRSTSEITFEDLGQESRILRGIGDLTASIPISLYELGGWPKRLMCTLVYSHTPIHPDERAFLKIKLNGALLEAREVTGQGGEKTISFDIPVRYLNPLNSLEITFSYYLNRGDCKGSLPEMEVTIFKDSFLSANGFQKKPPLTIGSYPSVFHGNGAIILSDLSPKFYIPIARFIEELGNFQKSPPKIDLVVIDEFKTKDYDYAMMHLSPNMINSVYPLVNLAPAFEIINPLTRKTLLKLRSEDSVAAIQVFYNNQDIPVLVYSEKDGASPFYKETSLNSVKLNSNLAIYKNNLWYSLQVGDKLRVIYPHQNDLEYYWIRYRLIIIVLFGTLFLVFFFYLYRRRTGD